MSDTTNIIREQDYLTLISAQKNAGIKSPIDSWDFYSGIEASAEIGKVFVDLLQNNYLIDENTKEGVARSLGAKSCSPCFNQIHALYLSAPYSPYEPSSLGYKGGLATALAEHARLDKSLEDDIYELAKDEANGLSRYPFFYHILRKSKSQKAKDLILHTLKITTNGTLREWLLRKEWNSYWKKNPRSE